jgi:hypothetical protein
MPFAFLAPGALAAIALAAVPVVVHMLRRAKATRLDFPSLRFLAETPSLVRRLAAPNDLVLLAARVAAIALVVLALARPVWVGAHGAVAPEARDTILLLDASASMTRAEIADRVKALARERVARLSGDARVRIATFGADLAWLSEWVEPERALAAIDGYAPTRALARPEAALRNAASALAARGGGTIAIVSDFQRSNGSWSTAGFDPSVAVEPIPVGGDLANAIVTGVAQTRGGDSPAIRVGLVESAPEQRALRLAEVRLAEGATAGGIRLERDGERWRAIAIAPDDLDVDDGFAFSIPESLGIAIADPGDAMP